MTVMRTWNPWLDMNRVRRELNQMAAANGEWWPHVRRPASFPAVNAFHSENGLVLTAELPGLDASQLDVQIEKNTVTLSGKRAEAAPGASGESYARRERWFEPFQRSIELPFAVDPDKCEASYEKGVLTVKLERQPDQQPKKLTIKAG